MLKRNKSTASLRATSSRPATAAAPTRSGIPKSRSVDKDLSKISKAATKSSGKLVGFEDSTGSTRAAKNWRKVRNVTSWALGGSGAHRGGGGKDKDGGGGGDGERDATMDAEPYPFDDKAVELLGKWCPYFETDFDPRKATVPLMMARVHECSKVVEKLVMEKADLYQQLDAQEERFRRLEGERGSRLHDAMSDMRKLREEHARLRGTIEALEKRSVDERSHAEYLERHILVQRASIERHVVKSAPPLGEVTVVFTEVSGAKELWADLPEQVMTEASAAHNDVLRYNLLQLGGYEVKVQRDAFLVSFDNPVDALCWASAVQLQLLSVRWPQRLLEHERAKPHDDPLTNRTAFRGLRVRMGVHTGMPKIVQRGKVVDAKTYTPDGGPVDYVGHTVLRAGRIQAAAHPGQVLLSDTTKLALRQYDAETLNHLHFEDLGEYHLKGLRVPEKLYSVLPRELRSRYFAPPVCDLPDPEAARDAMGDLKAAAANHAQAIERAKALYETSRQTADGLATRLRMGIADYTIEPRSHLKAAYSELEQILSLIHQHENHMEVEATKSRLYTERLEGIERSHRRMLQSINTVPKLREAVEDAERTNRSLLESHRLDKERHLKEIRSIMSQVTQFRRQAESAKVLLRELKHWWRREQLSLNDQKGASARGRGTSESK